MDKISIIIPVYNSEPYLKKCLDSVINQTYTNLEILCVDDGSCDGSAGICEEYAAKDNRFRVFHKEAKGGSGTPVYSLQKGLENFTGDYLGFIDPDDWIEPDMYEVLYNSLKRENVPISVVNYFKDYEFKSIPIINKNPISDGIISSRDMLLYGLKRDYYMGFLSYLWNKLFSAEVIKKCKIYFDTDIKYGFDTLFYYTLVLSGNCSGVYTDKLLYHYLQRDTSLSNMQTVESKSGILDVYKRVEALMNKAGYSDIAYWVRGFYCHHASVIAEIALKNNDMNTFKEMQKEIKNYLDDYIETNKEFPEKFERIYKLI